MSRITKRQKRRLRGRGVEAGKPNASRHRQPDPSRFRTSREDNLFGLLREFDNFSGLRAGLARVAERDDQWAGIPMPLDDARLIIHPKFPKATELMTMGRAARDEDEIETGHKHNGRKVRNVFYSDRRRMKIVIIEEPDGKITWGWLPAAHHFTFDMLTLGCSVAWGIEQEHNALSLLASLIRHHAFKQYLLTGMFMETSKRSKLTYVFRKLRPTVVLDLRGEESRILCALCMHPIAYYQGSWAGAMTPTDDVIAALMLMRGDEHMLWRRSNQHHPARPEAGL